MRKILTVIAFVFVSLMANATDVSISIGSPTLHIGVDLREYPQLVPISGYPVYYAPATDANYFFYDGLYWVYLDDNWYASSWYNGPWGLVDPYVVPVYILRVPVRYYRRPPVYFRGWVVDAPPRWDDHWGHDWHDRRHDWNNWNHRNVPRPSPLPVYQRQYVGDRYPDMEHQRDLQERNYHYQPRNSAVAAHFKEEHQQNQQWHAQQRNQPAPVNRIDDKRQQDQREDMQRKQQQNQEAQRQEQQRQEQQKQEQQKQEQQHQEQQRQTQQRQIEQRQEQQRQEQQQKIRNDEAQKQQHDQQVRRDMELKQQQQNRQQQEQRQQQTQQQAEQRQQQLQQQHQQQAQQEAQRQQAQQQQQVQQQEQQAHQQDQLRAQERQVEQQHRNEVRQEQQQNQQEQQNRQEPRREEQRNDKADKNRDNDK